MSKFFSFLIENKSQIQLTFIAAIFLSFFFPGHAVESLTIIAFVLFSLILFFKNESYHFTNFHLIFFLIYFWMLISFFWAENLTLFLEKIRIKSTLIALPFCFIFIDIFKFSYIVKFSYFLFFIVFCSLMIVGFNLYQNYDEILLSLRAGTAIPVPFRSHIRYSILLNFTLLLSIYISHEYFKLIDLKNSLIWLMFSVFILISILGLAVKTGVFLAILIIFFFLLYLIRKYQTYKIGILGIIVGLISFFYLINNIPTLKNKLDYFLYDLSQMKSNNVVKYSDASRIISIKKGFDIIKKSPWFGVGEGNVALYMTLEDISNAKLPHNQFVLAWAQNGVIGFLLFCFLFCIALFYAWNVKNWTFLTYTFAMIFACSVEPMLETQLGVAMFTLPLLFLYSIKPKT